MQYILSTEPTGTIPIALISEGDLAELHTRLIPLVVPSLNANGSKSKRKMKEVMVKITDKSDDINVNNGKVLVCDHRYIFRSNTGTQGSFYRRRMKRYLLALQPMHLSKCNTRESPSVRPSEQSGSAKCTPPETGLYHAGGTELPTNATP
jgi:hypothetical protein